MDFDCGVLICNEETLNVIHFPLSVTTNAKVINTSTYEDTLSKVILDIILPLLTQFH